MFVNQKSNNYASSRHFFQNTIYISIPGACAQVEHNKNACWKGTICNYTSRYLWIQNQIYVWEKNITSNICLDAHFSNTQIFPSSVKFIFIHGLTWFNELVLVTSDVAQISCCYRREKPFYYTMNRTMKPKQEGDLTWGIERTLETKNQIS